LNIKDKDYSNRFRPPKINRKFIHGPITIEWIKLTKALGTDAFFVGIALHHFSGMNKNRNRFVFKASFEELTLGCCSRRSVMNGVLKLENAKLIKVIRNPGQKNMFDVDTVCFKL
jgi:hypothetical protein